MQQFSISMLFSPTLDLIDDLHGLVLKTLFGVDICNNNHWNKAFIIGCSFSLEAIILSQSTIHSLILNVSIQKAVGV